MTMRNANQCVSTMAGLIGGKLRSSDVWTCSASYTIPDLTEFIEDNCGGVNEISVTVSQGTVIKNHDGTFNYETRMRNVKAFRSAAILNLKNKRLLTKYIGHLSVCVCFESRSSGTREFPRRSSFLVT